MVVSVASDCSSIFWRIIFALRSSFSQSLTISISQQVTNGYIYDLKLFVHFLTNGIDNSLSFINPPLLGDTLFGKTILKKKPSRPLEQCARSVVLLVGAIWDPFRSYLGTIVEQISRDFGAIWESFLEQIQEQGAESRAGSRAASKEASRA